MRPQFFTIQTFLITLTVVTFLALPVRALWEPDEGRYAGIAAAMARSGDWIVPHENGMLHLDKPPMVMWLTGAAFLLGGTNEWTARIVPWLSGGILLCVGWGFLRRKDDSSGSVYYPIVLGGSLYWICFTNILNLDMAIAACITVSLALFWRGYQDESAWRWTRPGFWVMLSAGFLTKGLISAVLPIGVVVAFALSERSWKPVRFLLSWPSIAVAAVISLPWLIAMEFRVPGYNWFFFVHEHVLRFATTGADRDKPWWYFPVLLLGGFFPWSCILFQRQFWRRRYREFQTDSRARFLTIWFVLILAFFMTSHSKLPGYVLPVAVPFAWMLASAWADRQRPRWAGAIALGWSGIISVVAIGSALWDIGNEIYHWEFHTDLLGAIPLSALAALVFVDSVRNRSHHTRLPVLTASALVLGYFPLVVGASWWDTRQSTRDLTREIEATAPGARVLQLDVNFRTLPYYLKRATLLSDPRGEHYGFPGDWANGRLPGVLARNEVSALVNGGDLVLVVADARRWQRDAIEFGIDPGRLVFVAAGHRWRLFSNQVIPSRDEDLP